MSYNALHVPLDIGTWQCTLMLRCEYEEQARRRQWARERDRDRDRNRSTNRHSWSWLSRRDAEDEAEHRQREDDRCTFLRYFRPNYDFRRLIPTDIMAITSFLGDHLNVVHWNLPTDNASIERLLKQAVEDGRLVPVVDRDWRSYQRTFRPAPAPERWPQSYGGGTSVPTARYGLSAVVSGGPTLGDASTAVESAGASGGFDWLGVAETVANGALDGDYVTATDDASAGDDTPLGDAQPFELADDTNSGDAMDIAARGVSEADEAECFAQYERDMDECTAFRSAMGGQRFMDACSQRAFENYQQCRGY
ncbi:hypothetical protein FAZ95_13695 [Trinickia violacea]|uniref:Uncharacterized protein n=1 Tax=Trinickia violacea TaxID=2571746 RepID=A0A4P8IP82_9BURK|nr:hypothetical protein [Trinickia violacea]QCP50136.1 hypothetical protein FAZ95_13695 [Trinickia violacea]